VKFHTIVFEDPHNDKKKIENFETSKYQNKIPSKFTRKKTNISFPSVVTQIGATTSVMHA
jgi:hypothetical protein